MKTIANQLMEALGTYEATNTAYLAADSAFEESKSLFGCKEAEIIRLAEGRSESEKKRNAKLSEEYQKELKAHLEILRVKNMARAAKEGADARVNSLRSMLSYEKALISQGIYSPKPQQNG